MNGNSDGKANRNADSSRDKTMSKKIFLKSIVYHLCHYELNYYLDKKNPDF